MNFIGVMMHRHDFSLEEARAEWKDALDLIRDALEEGEDPEDVLLDLFGLEPDYLEEFLPYL